MPNDKQYEVRMVVTAKDATQAAGRALIGPNRENQVFITDLDDESGKEIVFMLNKHGNPKEVKPGELVDDEDSESPNAGTV